MTGLAGFQVVCSCCSFARLASTAAGVVSILYALLAAQLEAADDQLRPLWRYCPAVGYLDEALPIHLSVRSVTALSQIQVVPADPQSASALTVVRMDAPDEIRLQITGQQHLQQQQAALQLRYLVEDATEDGAKGDANQPFATLWFLTPQAKAWQEPGAVRWDGAALSYRGGRVILLAQRDEALADRRWSMLRRPPSLQMVHQYTPDLLAAGGRVLLGALPDLAEKALPPGRWMASVLKACSCVSRPVRPIWGGASANIVSSLLGGCSIYGCLACNPLF